MSCLLERLKSLGKDKKMSKIGFLSVWQNVSLCLNLFLIVEQYGITGFFKKTSWACCPTLTRDG